MTIAKLEHDRIVLPGIATVHSHAFQRALRARTERPSTAAKTFWSWRGLMYALAQKLNPESIYALSHYAFVELALAGVTTVGEFHYVQHQADGTPYDDRIVLADAVIRAARDAGLRIVLLRVMYERAGAGLPPEPGQRRFCDAKPDDAFRDLEAISSRFKGDSAVSIGIAPHSLRAVKKETLRAALAYARTHDLPLHMHVAEQPREVDECVHEHGMRPVEFLDAFGALDENFVAVHATHLADNEIALMSDANSIACICRSTERDLGDGLSRAAGLHAAGVRITTGIDSHSITDPFEELRSIELDERSRFGKRHAAIDATALLDGATRIAFDALGLGSRHHDDRVELDANHVALLGAANDDLIDDHVVYAGAPSAIRNVTVAGNKIVVDGKHPKLEAARDAYLKTLRTLV